jgi:hypothetical protein
VSKQALALWAERSRWKDLHCSTSGLYFASQQLTLREGESRGTIDNERRNIRDCLVDARCSEYERLCAQVRS